MNIILSVLMWIGVKMVEALPGKLVDGILALFGHKRPGRESKPGELSLYPSDCGDRALDLGFRKPHVAEAFGGYFAGLLEDAGGYLRIDEQIDCPSTLEAAKLAPVERILYEFRRPTGPRLIALAAAGGMGKTTLAAKIVKCLHEQKDAELILGDSAKTEHTDATTGNIYKLDPTFQDARSFYRRLYVQVGLPPPPATLSTGRMLDTLTGQLRDFHAIIVVDNLDVVKNGRTLLSTLQPLLGRNTRAVVTTREIASLEAVTPLALTVRLQPLTTIENARTFLAWHIHHYQAKRPQLLALEKGVADQSVIKALIKKTGGIPLVMQLVLNTVETRTWSYLEKLPTIELSSELLDYLYKERWVELERLGPVGAMARQAVGFIAAQQMKGKRIAFADLNQWAQKTGTRTMLSEALRALDDRFLVLNRDVEQGNYSVFPSLAEFVAKNVAAYSLNP